MVEIKELHRNLIVIHIYLIKTKKSTKQVDFPTHSVDLYDYFQLILTDNSFEKQLHNSSLTRLVCF